MGDGEQNVNNLPFIGLGNSTIEGGEIFNDIETNKSFNSYSHTEGTENISSTMGYKILNMAENGLAMQLEGDASNLLDSLIITNRDERGLENSISFQWSQNFDLCCNIVVAEYQSGTNTTNVAIDKCPDGFDLSLATSGWLWVPTNPEIGNIQLGTAAHTEGYGNKAVQVGSHAEGYNNIAAGKYSHTEGKNTIAVYAAHSEGMSNKSLGICSHTEGSQNIAKRGNTHAEGYYTQALFDNAHAEGSNTIAGTSTGGNAAHAEGSLSQALGDASHAEGNKTQATAQYAHAEGDKSIASGVASHAEGNGVASGAQSHAEGSAIASNEKAHAEGSSSKATGKISHAEGDSTNANGLASHAEGSWTTVDADFGHSEGTGTVVSGSARGGHAEGISTKAQQEGAHSEGINTDANAKGAHAGGIGTVAILDAQTAIGRYNAEEWDGSLFVIGNGSAAVKDENGNITTPEVRSTAFKVKDNGDVILKSGLIKGVKTPIDNTDAANKTYVDTKVSEALSNKLTRTIVNDLSDISIADENTIYMVPATTAAENNIYNEYMFINGAFELIGSTAVDISNKQDKFANVTNDEYEGQLVHSTLTFSAPNVDCNAGYKLTVTAAEEMGLLSKSTSPTGGFYFGHYDSPFVADKYGIYRSNDNPSSRMSVSSNSSLLFSEYHGFMTSSNITPGLLYDDNYANVIVDKSNENIYLHTNKIIVGKSSDVIHSNKTPTLGTITNLADPVNSTDAVNKQYVDGAINNINIPTVVQEAGNSESLVMSQKAVTDLVSSAIGTTEYETVDSVNKMTDTTKSYILSTTGTIWTYGEVTTEKEAENKLVPSTATLNQRLSGSSGSVSVNSGAVGSFVTDFIAVTDLDGITPFNVRLNWEMPQTLENKVVFYDSNKTRIAGNVFNMVETETNPANAAISNGETIIDIKTKGANSVSFPNWANVAYLRFQLFVKPSGTSITSTDVENLTITFDAESGTITENKWYDTGLTPSASGNENYVNLLVKINDNTSNINEIDSRVTTLETKSDSVTIPSFWQNAVDNCITKIKNLQVGRNCVTFPFFSDNHQRNGYAGMLIAHIMKECYIPYCFFGGDSIDSGYIASESVMIAQDKKFDTMMSYVPNGRLCRAVGNHDGYWAVSADEKHYYTDAQNYELFLREESIAQNKHFGGDGTYYYIDDIASKVRWIVLDTNDAVVEAEQLSWLQNTALSFNESGWAIVFISHQPISNHYHANISNAAEVRTIVSNYINGSSSNKADVIGWFSGHIHRDRIYEGVAVNTTDDSIGAAMPFKQITITSDHTGISYDNATKHTVANDDKSHAIDFVTVNKTTRTVNLTRLGIGEDRSYSY